MSSGDAPSDGEVVRRVLAGAREDYAVLVRRYRDRYARYAARMLGSVDAAEDAVQDALVRAFEQLAQCREPEKFAGWFFLILRNRCFAEKRRQGRGGRPLEEEDARIASAARADQVLEAAEQRRALIKALGHLTPEQREVFVLKHIEEKSYDEIAELTQSSVASLKMRMHRAYDRLRAELGDLV